MVILQYAQVEFIRDVAHASLVLMAMHCCCYATMQQHAACYSSSSLQGGHALCAVKISVHVYLQLADKLLGEGRQEAIGGLCQLGQGLWHCDVQEHLQTLAHACTMTQCWDVRT